MLKVLTVGTILNSETFANYSSRSVSSVAVFWDDFVQNLVYSAKNESAFVYEDLISFASNKLKHINSQFINDLILGKKTIGEYTMLMNDKKKVIFAEIINYIVNQASFGVVKIEKVGTFFLKGKLGHKVINPQTGVSILVPLSITLGFALDDEFLDK